MCALRDRTARPPEYLGCVTAFRTRGSIPCAAMRLSLHEKRRDHFRHAFCLFNCLTNTPLKAGFCGVANFSKFFSRLIDCLRAQRHIYPVETENRRPEARSVRFTQQVSSHFLTSSYHKTCILSTISFLSQNCTPHPQNFTVQLAARPLTNSSMRGIIYKHVRKGTACARSSAG